MTFYELGPLRPFVWALDPCKLQCVKLDNETFAWLQNKEGEAAYGHPGTGVWTVTKNGFLGGNDITPTCLKKMAQPGEETKANDVVHSFGMSWPLPKEGNS